MSLTDKGISKLVREAPKGVRTQYKDSSTRGFGLRIEKNGRVSFYFYGKVGGRVVFRSLGEYPTTPLAAARDEAVQLKAKASAWRKAGYAGPDPFAKAMAPEQPKRKVPTVRELLEAYIVGKVRIKANSPESAEKYTRWMVKKYLGGWLDRPVDEITPADLKQVKDTQVGKIHTQHRIVQLVRAMFNWCKDTAEGGVTNFWPIAKNPATGFKIVRKLEPPRERYLLKTELARFNDAVDKEKHQDLKDFLILTMNTMARRNDVLSMAWDHVDLDRAVWRVEHPKGGERYIIALLSPALAVLKQRKEKRTASPFVFPGPGRKGHLTNVRKPWNSFRKRTKFTDLTIHDLRRTAASYAVQGGASLQQTAAMLGHSPKNMVSVLVYSQFEPDFTREARERGMQHMAAVMKANKPKAAKHARLARLVATSPKRLTAGK